MPSTLIDYNRLSAVSKTINPTKPVFVLNLLRYKEFATYHSAHPSYTSLPPVSGREAYLTRYISTIQPIMPPNAAPIFFGKTIAGVLATTAAAHQNQDGRFQVAEGEGEGLGEADWDNVAIVRYECFKHFQDMVESEEYRENAMPHRVAAIEDYRLIVCEEVGI